jgi:hypothetical protein
MTSKLSILKPSLLLLLLHPSSTKQLPPFPTASHPAKRSTKPSYTTTTPSKSLSEESI